MRSPRMLANFPTTRVAALAQWQAFLPHVPAYTTSRNHLEGGVSRLSPAIRHRLLTEDEIVAETLTTHSFAKAEKWLQEVCWRRYWRGWLEHRPGVWQDARKAIFSRQTVERAEAVARGQSGVAAMDVLARELLETGWLHNHARMWWAGFWCHTEKLPWQLGAAHFFRHLLDADSASNTLSWRWVAGLQTQGKTYLTRRSNLEKYAPQLVREHPEGLHRLDDHLATPYLVKETADTRLEPLAQPKFGPLGAKPGLWLHADDLLPEVGPLAEMRFSQIVAFTSQKVYSELYGLSVPRQAFLHACLADAAVRAGVHFNCPSQVLDTDSTPKAVGDWARDHGLTSVVTLRPFVGPVGDVAKKLEIPVVYYQRESDAGHWTHAKRGFFPYWEQTKAALSAS
jgi:deoxyribodipyrimidine photo-lyase